MTYNSAKRLVDLFIGIRGTKAVGKIVTSDSSEYSMVYSSHQFFLQKIYPWSSKDYSAFVLLRTKQS